MKRVGHNKYELTTDTPNYYNYIFHLLTAGRLKPSTNITPTLKDSVVVYEGKTLILLRT